MLRYRDRRNLEKYIKSGNVSCAAELRYWNCEDGLRKKVLHIVPYGIYITETRKVGATPFVPIRALGGRRTRGGGTKK